MEKKPTVQITTSPLSSGRSSSSSDRQVVIEEPLDDSKPSSSTGKSSSIRAKDSVSREKDALCREMDSIFRERDSIFKRRAFVPKDRRRFRLRSRGDSVKDDYDFAIDRNPTKATNIKTGIAALVKGCLGGGMVAMHEAYMDCGLWTSMGVNVFLGIVITYCMYMLTRSAQKMYVRIQVSTLSYPDLAEATLEVGPWDGLRKYSRCFRHTVETFICISGFGACCAYEVMIAHSIEELIEASENFDMSVVSRDTERVYVAVLVVPCVLLTIFTTVKELAPFSVVANFYVVLIALSTIYYGSWAATRSPLDMPAYKTLSGLFKFTGVVMFSLDGVGVILAVENSIKNPKQFPYVLAGGMTIVVLMVVVIGSFGYWGFGEKCVSPVTVNFPWFTYPITLKMFVALMIFATFGLNFCNPFNIVWYYIAPYHNPDWHWIWERVYRALVVIITISIAVALPNVNNIIGFLGSFCLSHTGCIFPAFISLVLDWEKPGPGKCYWRLWKTIILILFGWFLFIVGTVVNARDLVVEVYFPEYRKAF